METCRLLMLTTTMMTMTMTMMTKMKMETCRLLCWTSFPICGAPPELQEKPDYHIDDWIVHWIPTLSWIFILIITILMAVRTLYSVQYQPCSKNDNTEVELTPRWLLAVPVQILSVWISLIWQFLTDLKLWHQLQTTDDECGP